MIVAARAGKSARASVATIALPNTSMAAALLPDDALYIPADRSQIVSADNPAMICARTWAAADALNWARVQRVPGLARLDAGHAHAHAHAHTRTSERCRPSRVGAWQAGRGLGL